MKKLYVMLRSCERAFSAAESYDECTKNHAASPDGYVVDGCREFMAGGEDWLKCAACGCHRSFHRIVMQSDQGIYDCCTSSLVRRQ